MDIKIQETNPTRRSVTVTTVPAAQTVAAARSRTRASPARPPSPASVQGKAPEAIVRQKYGKQIADEVSQRLLSRATSASSRRSPSPSTPSPTSRKEAGSGADAVFRYEVDVVPDFETPDWKAVKVPIEEVTVAEADIDQHLQKILEQRARYEKTEDAAAKGDYVRIGYVGTVDGKPVGEVDAEAKLLRQRRIHLGRSRCRRRRRRRPRHRPGRDRPQGRRHRPGQQS
jgi:trigger factor